QREGEDRESAKPTVKEGGRRLRLWPSLGDRLLEKEARNGL
ncbi:unnamed protein product, partial [marine sediment metagenome]